MTAGHGRPYSSGILAAALEKRMKTLRCRENGSDYGHEIRAEHEDEVLHAPSTHHLTVTPLLAEQVKSLIKEEPPVGWGHSAVPRGAAANRRRHLFRIYVVALGHECLSAAPRR